MYWILVLLTPLAVGALMLLGYLAACAGAGRWITFSDWWGTNK